MKEGCSFVWHSESNPIAPSGLTPRSRYKHAACIYDCRVYIFGGKDGNLPLKDLWRFDLRTNTWESLKWTGDPLPNLQEHSMVAHQNKIYIFGGSFQSGSDHDIPFWILDLGLMVCRKQTGAGAFPDGRRGHSAVVYKDSMFIFAGFIDLRRSSNELWSFNFDLERWSLLKPDDGLLPVGRHGHSAVAFQHFMCIYGGLADLETKDDLWLFDFSATRWVRLKPSLGPPPLEGHSACVTRNLMVLFGGCHEGVLQGDLWAFDFDFGVWQKLTCKGTEQIPRSKHSAVLTSHGDWCCRPSCINSSVGFRRAGSCPSSSSGAAAQRGTRLTSSSRLVNEKNPQMFGYSNGEGRDKPQTGGAMTSVSVNEPASLSENILYNSSAKLEAVPLISDPHSNFSPVRELTNPTPIQLLRSDVIPVSSNGMLYPDRSRVYPDEKSCCAIDPSRNIRVPKTTKEMEGPGEDFSKMGIASVVNSRVKYAGNLSNEEAETKTRHVLAANLLGTPTKFASSSGRSLSDDGCGRLESPLEFELPLCVEMEFFGCETKAGRSPSRESLIFQDFENSEAKDNISFISDEECVSPKRTKETEQTRFPNSNTGLALADGVKGSLSHCLAGRNVKEAWASPSNSLDRPVSPDDVVMETEEFRRSGPDDQTPCRVELFQAKSKLPFQCPEFSMFVLGGRSSSSATNFEVQPISVSRLEINLGKF